MWLNDYVMAMACRKDEDRRSTEHVSTTQHMGKDDLDVTLVLCSEPFDLHVKKIGFHFLQERALFTVMCMMACIFGGKVGPITCHFNGQLLA